MKPDGFCRFLLSTTLTLLAQMGSAVETSPALKIQQPQTRPTEKLLKPDLAEQSFTQPANLKDLAVKNLEARNPIRLSDERPILSGGGADTGGGNALGSAKVSPEKIANYIKTSKGPSVYILRRLEFILSNQMGSSTFGSLAKTIFQGPKSIYQALQEAELNPQLQGPCFDSEGTEVDASAKDYPKICFSLERLSKTMNKDSVQAEILAIVIHEVSHGVDADQDAAIFLQETVKESLANDPFNKIPSLINLYREEVKAAIESLNYLYTHLSQLEKQEICAGLSSLLPTVNALLQKNMNSLSDSEKNGIAYSSPKHIADIQGVVLKSINSISYCMGNQPNYKPLINAYKGKDHMPLKEFQSSLYQNGQNMLAVPNWTIRQLHKADLKTLKDEIQDMQTALEEVLTNI